MTCSIPSVLLIQINIYLHAILFFLFFYTMDIYIHTYIWYIINMYMYITFCILVFFSFENIALTNSISVPKHLFFYGWYYNCTFSIVCMYHGIFTQSSRIVFQLQTVFYGIISFIQIFILLKLYHQDAFLWVGLLNRKIKV